MVSRFVLVIFVLLLGACASSPRPAPPAEVERQAPPPPVSDQGTQTATRSLVLEAREARESGRCDRAAGLLQRAQRIDSRDGEVYLEFARLYLEQGDTGESAAMAERGLSYCSGDTCAQLKKLR